MKPSRLVTSGGVRRHTVRGMKKITKAALVGGWMSSRVCPPDPANPAIPLPWVPDQACAFRK
jgi:hypothetical protein